jgi:lysyl-tRNA synthetase class 2
MTDKLDMAKQRALFIQSARNFFILKDYLEVETPILSPYLLPEPSIEVFVTEYLNPQKEKIPLYMIPSPELWMKRLISEKFPNIFQITKCFRNYESSGNLHNPEFSMLEWYSLDSGYLDEIKMVEELFTFIAGSLRIPDNPDISAPFTRLSMKEAFMEYAGLPLDDLFDLKKIHTAGLDLGLLITENDTWEETFNKIFLTCVEPKFSLQTPLILYDYPASIPTFARQKKGTPYYERWELYFGGIEIANCYSEETNKQLLTDIIRQEAMRKKKCNIDHKIAITFPDFFHDKFPACSGVALGLDRLFMSVYGISRISEAMLFPLNELF